jgi:hypothetical protein
MLTCHSFQYIIRLLNTNVDGKQKVMYALTKIKGVGRRYSNLVCKKADVDLSKRAGDLTSEELERIVTIIQNPLQCTFNHPPLTTLPSNTPQTRSPPGSSTGSATSSTARTPRSSPTASTPSSARTSSASRRSALTVVSVTTGASASVVSTPRPPAAAVALSVSPRRRAKYYALPAGDSIRGWRGGVYLSRLYEMGGCFFTWHSLAGNIHFHLGFPINDGWTATKDRAQSRSCTTKIYQRFQVHLVYTCVLNLNGALLAACQRVVHIPARQSPRLAPRGD